ncbi:hypothetical protein HTG_10665 [Natrinema mahii]|nr:hypothetical protein HTG_10665 [Natrinema mahii]
MRETSPGIHYNTDQDRYEVFTWDAVRTVLEDWETFSSDTELPTDRMNVLDDTIFNIDPPRHPELRDVANDFFRPSEIQPLESRIRSLATELLDEVEDDGEMDLVADFAIPLPIIVIAELLGIPEDDRSDFRSWCRSLTRIRTEDETELIDEQAAAGQEFATYMYEIIEERKQNPRDDLISRFVHADIDGDPLTFSEIIGFPALLLIAGNITTTGLITNTVRTFAEEDPSLFDELAGNASALETAIEEVARYQSSVPAVSRTVTRQTTVLETTVEPGKPVIVWLASANRDSGRFDDAETFVPDRHPNPHIGYGHGIHTCLGASLARLETKVAVSQLLSRFDDLSVDCSTPDPIWNTFMHGVERLPVEFEAP